MAAPRSVAVHLIGGPAAGTRTTTDRLWPEILVPDPTGERPTEASWTPGELTAITSPAALVYGLVGTPVEPLIWDGRYVYVYDRRIIP